MALFHRKVDEGSKVPGYSIGAVQSILIVGLGNPGTEHVSTRHNIGFAILERFALQNEFPAWHAKADLKCQLSVHTLGESRVILCKPTTFMNNSGEVASAVQKYFRVYNNSTLAVYDELALDYGQLRARVGGSDAGHNGVKSLIQHLGDDFGRLRIGIGNDISRKAPPIGKQADDANFVLGKFTKTEQGHLGQVTQEASAMISVYIFSGELPHDTRTIL